MQLLIDSNIIRKNHKRDSIEWYLFTLSSTVIGRLQDRIVLWLSGTDLYYTRGAQRVLPMRVGGATSQLDLPSLTPLSVASCGRLQQGVPIGPLQ